MSRLRIVSFLAATAVAAALAAQQPAAEPKFAQQFGERGAPGSFLLQFDDRGAGVVWLQLLDHYVDAAAAHKEHPGDDDYQLLLWAGTDADGRPVAYSFRLEEPARAGETRRFAADLGTA